MGITSPSPQPRTRWLDAAALIAVAGAGLQLYQWFGARPLWLDEQMIAVNLRDRTLGNFWGPLWLGQIAPLGWLMLQRLSVLALGTG